MTRRQMLLTLIAVALVASGAMFYIGAHAEATVDCTRVGTDGPDRIQGTTHADVLCARGGRDYANGHEASDGVRGGPQSDTLVGGEGHDIIRGNGGDDDLFGTDGTGTDVLVGGPGRDRCYGDRGDVFAASCEKKVRV